MKYLVSLFLIFFVLIGNAAVYMQKEKNGNIIYSDTPLENGAEVITNPDEINIQTTTNNSSSTEKSPNKEAIKSNYTEFSIVSPAEGEAIQNQPTFDIIVKIEPALQADDKIQFYLDGNAVQEPSSSTQISLENVDRGTHTVTAKLLNKENQVLKESSATIYVHRASVNQPSRQ